MTRALVWLGLFAGFCLAVGITAATPVWAQQPPGPNNSVGLIGQDSSTHLPCYVAATTGTTCVVPGSSSGGGGGAITAASGSYASGAFASGAFSAGSISLGAAVSGAFADCAITTLGCEADAAWVSGSGTDTSILKAIANAAASPLATQAQTVSIGGVGLLAGSNLAGGFELYDGAGTNKAVVKAAAAPTTSDNQLVVSLSPIPSPVCTSFINISQTTTTDVYTSTAKMNICSIILISATAQSIGVDEGTGTTCESSGTAIIGVSSTSGATPTLAVAANGGFSAVAERTWLKTKTTGDHLCILQSGSGNVSGVITYADAS